MGRIICIGNRYAPGDDIGIQVYDYLSKVIRPPHIEIIEGGLAGLDLLYFFTDAHRLVFIDAVEGFGLPGEMIIFGATEIAQFAVTCLDHNSGLPYLLRVMLELGEHDPALVRIIGIERGYPHTESSVKKIAETACVLISSSETHWATFTISGAQYDAA